MIQIVEDNKSKYTKREVRNAERARSLMRKLGPPSQQDFEHYLKENFIRNCPLTVFDAKRAVKIFWSEVYSLKGKMARRQGQHVPTFNPIRVEPSILNEYEMTLCAWIIFT